MGFDSQGKERFFSSPQHSDWLWGPTCFLINGVWGLLPQGKVAGEWGWTLTYIWCQS